MLARYQMLRGKRPPDNPLPDGVRIDVRKHTAHVLAPEPNMVDALLVDPEDPKRVERFRKAYLALLEHRYERDHAPFDDLARQAKGRDVFIGCSCPTRRQPEVGRCHTVLALRIMADRYSGLDVRLP
jgi:hypothetical protein